MLGRFKRLSCSMAAFSAVLFAVVLAAQTAGAELGSGEFRYFGVLYGPPIQSISALQGRDGTPLNIRNFLSWSTRIDPETKLGITASWNWRPVFGQDLTLRDPFLKIAKPSAWSSGDLEWYTDLRLHLPVTAASRQRDLWLGIQSFNSFDWSTSQGGAGIYASVRYNQLGALGVGDEWEFYVAPHVHWQALSNVSVGALLEWGGGAPFEAESAGIIFSDGFSLEPGISWDVTRRLNLSPYLDIPLGSTQENGLPTQTTLGLTGSWRFDSP